MNARLRVTKQIRQMVNDEVRKQMQNETVEMDDNYDAVVLYTLHAHYGWGEKRLKDFYNAFSEEFERLKKYYSFDDNADTIFVCKYALKKIGVDVEAMNAEKRGEML